MKKTICKKTTKNTPYYINCDLFRQTNLKDYCLKQTMFKKFIEILTSTGFSFLPVIAHIRSCYAYLAQHVVIFVRNMYGLEHRLWKTR